MARRKRSKKRKQPKSPLKKLSRSENFGKVKNYGETSLENVGKRHTLHFLRQKNPDWCKAEMVWFTSFSKKFVDKHWDSESLADKPRKGRPRLTRTPEVMKALANSRGRLKGNSTRVNAKNLSQTKNKVSRSSISRAFNLFVPER